MKDIASLCSKTFLFGLLTIVLTDNVSAQDKDSTIKNIVEARQFVFHAQTALPSTGGSRQLTSAYDLKVWKDSLVSYLPYFGRAYSTTYGATDGGLNFTSTNFDYKTSTRKKGGWEISIKPTDVTEFREFLLTISENGYGTLRALTNNRQPISFNGYISSKK
jgi:Domain of unknown function (DUF4251)